MRNVSKILEALAKTVFGLIHLAGILAACASVILLVMRSAGLHGSVHEQVTIQEIQEMTALTVLKVPVADVVETRIDGRTGGIRALLRVRGEVLMGVDLTRARIVTEDAGRRKLTLRLPKPTALSCRLDHQATSLYSIDRHGLWTLSPLQRPTTAVVNKSFADAEQYVGDVAHHADVVAAAKAHTEAVLRQWADRAGWTIEISWAD